MRVPVVTSDRIRDWFSNTQKTNTMVVDPIESKIEEDKKVEKQAFEQLKETYAHMVKLSAPLQVQMIPQGHEDELVNQAIQERFQQYRDARNDYRSQFDQTEDPNMPVRHAWIGGMGGAGLGGGLGYSLARKPGAVLGALGGFVPGALLGSAHGKARHETLYPGQLRALTDKANATSDAEADLEDIASLNPAAYRRARILGGYQDVPKHDDTYERHLASKREAEELSAYRRKLELEHQIKSEIAAREAAQKM